MGKNRAGEIEFESQPERGLKLLRLSGSYAICRIEATGPVPTLPLTHKDFWSLTQTADELSLVCLEEHVRDDVRAEPGWCVLKLEGPFAFNETGVLSSVLGPLGEAGVGIFAVSTFDTDYVLVKQDDFARAAQVLRDAGHAVHE